MEIKLSKSKLPFFAALSIILILTIINNSAIYQGTVYLQSPANQSYTNQNNSTLQFIYNHTGSLGGTVNCTLYLDGIPVN